MGMKPRRILPGMLEEYACSVSAIGLHSPQLTAFFTSALIFASPAEVNSFSAKAVGPMARSGWGISAIFASTALSPSALSARGPGRAAAIFAACLAVLLALRILLVIFVPSLGSQLLFHKMAKANAVTGDIV